MRVTARTILIITVVLAAVLSAGCSKKKKDAAAKAAAQKKKVEVPKAVMAYVGLQNPKNTIDEGLAMVKKFIPQLPYNRTMLMGLFAREAKLPQELIEAVDMAKPFWLVGLDKKQVDSSEAFVLAIPLVSKSKFLSALKQKMKEAGTEGGLTTYKPKQGQVGLKEIKLKIEDKYVFVPSNKKAMDSCESYLRTVLLKKKPSHDLELHVLVSNVLKAQGESFEQGVDRAMAKMKQNLVNQPGPIDQKPMANATETILRRYLELLKSTREVVVFGDLSPDGIVASLTAQALDGGEMHKVIKRQRPGEPLGLDRLPASSWLVMSDHGNPESIQENRKTWEPAIKEIFSTLELPDKEAFLKTVTSLMMSFSGDSTFAVHRAPSGPGMTISVVGTVKDGAKQGASVDKLVSTLGDLIKAEMKKKGEKLPPGTKFEKKAFSHKGAKGAILSLNIPDKAMLPPDKRKVLDTLVGGKLSMGWAFSDKLFVMAALKDTEQQLKLLVEGKAADKAYKTLSANKTFIKAAKAAPNRVGVFYISLVSALLTLDGAGLPELASLLTVIKGRQVNSSPSLDWGVNADRDQLDVTLRLPLEELQILFPAVMQLQQRRMMSGMRRR